VLLVPGSPLTAATAPGSLDEIRASQRVTPALAAALEQQERVVAKVYFQGPMSAGKTLDLQRSPDRAQVSPVVVELAQEMLPGKLRLLDQVLVQALQGTVDARVVQSFLHNPQVLSIDLAETTVLPEIEESRLVAKTTCVPSSTRACVRGTRFALNVYFGSGGTPAGVATSSADSAVFWFSSSTNWEVVAKVLDGCAINNHFWIFTAGATTLTYVVDVYDTTTGTIVAFGNTCPNAYTTLDVFKCS
jgi:hypothetical protein